MNPNKKDKSKSLSAPFKKLFKRVSTRATSPVPVERSDDNFSTNLSRESTLVAMPVPAAPVTSTPAMTNAPLEQSSKKLGDGSEEIAESLRENRTSGGPTSSAPVITITDAQDSAHTSFENRGDRNEEKANNDAQGKVAEEPSTGQRAAALAYEGLKEGLRLVVRCTDAFPLAKSATQGVLEIFERYDAITGIPGELADLKDKLQALAVTLQENEVLAIRDRLSGLARMFEEKTKTINAKLERNIGARIIESTEDVQFLSREIRSITFAIEIVMMDVNLKTHTMVSELHHIALLDKLKYVEGAGFDHEDRQGCANGTRMLLLADVLTWATESKNEHIFWLNGMAGTGKTAVAETLCNLLAGKGILGSSFFCSRKTSDRRKVNLIFPSLASALAYKYPEFQEELIRVLQNCLDPTGMDLEKQYKTLLMEPARLAFAKHSGSIVLAVDALDECEDQQAAETFLKIILKEKSPGMLRFFVTSRPETKIRKGFSAGMHASVRLQDIETHIVKADIKVYLLAALEEIDDLQSEYDGPWPPAEVETIVENSGNLFIYAATAVKYISDERGDPIERLRKYASITPPSNAVEAIDEVYLFVLRDAFYQLDVDEQKRVQLCLQAVVCTLEPLSVAMYSILLGMSALQVRRAFASLHSVVQIPEEKKNDLKIILYHASFSDYLTSASRTRSAAWYIEISSAHTMLVDQCLQLMMSKLHFNIAQAATSHQNNKAQNLKVDPDLEYTCGAWSNHLFLSVIQPNLIPVVIASKIEQFFLEKFLYWLEVLSVINKAQYAAASLSHIYRITESSALRNMCREFATFISKHLAAIKLSAPHIYLSALPWVAPNSILGQNFLSKFSHLPKIIDSKEPDAWEPLVIQLHGHTDWVYSVAYSPDGKHLASGSGDETIRIWNAETGQQTLQINVEKINAIFDIELSSDGQYIISGSSNNIVQIWDAGTGIEAFPPLEGHSGVVFGVAISPDRKYLASGSDDNTVRFWDFQTRALLFEGSHQDTVNYVTFSPSGNSLASASDDSTIKIWSGENYKEVKTLKGHTDNVLILSYSQDGNYLVSAGHDRSIRVWNTKTGKQKFKAIKGHEESVNAACFSPNQKIIASASDDFTIRFWDAETGKEAGKTLKNHYDDVNSIAYSHSGKHFASGSTDKRVLIWEVQDREMVLKFTIDGHASLVTAVVFSLDDKFLYSASHDSTVKKWDVLSGHQDSFNLQTCFFTEPNANKNRQDADSSSTSSSSTTSFISCGVLSIVYSPKGQYIVSGSEDTTVRIWDANTGELKFKPLLGHDEGVYSVAISPDEKYIASGSSDKTVRLWDFQTGNQVYKALRGHKGEVNAVAFSPNSKFLVSGDSDCCIRVWNMQTGEMVSKIQKNEEENGPIHSLVFTSDGQSILCALDSSRDLKIWDLWPTTGKQDEKTFSGHLDGALSADFSSNGAYIVSGSEDNSVRVWSTETRKELLPALYGHSDTTLCVTFAPDGKSVASGSADNTINIWHISEALQHSEKADDKSTQTASPPNLSGMSLEGHQDYVNSVAFSPDGKFIASGCDDNSVGVWDIDTGTPKFPLLKSHEDPVGAVAWSPNNQLIASGSDDKTIILWNANTGALDGILKGHSSGLNSIAFSPDGEHLVSCSYDKTVRIWSLKTRKQAFKALQGHSDCVNSISYSADGNLIVSASDDETLRIWNAKTGAKFTRSLKGHKDIVTSAVFTPDGKYIISGSRDESVFVWDIHADFKKLRALEGHNDSITSVAVTPDSKYALSASRDEAIVIWDLATGKCTTFPLAGHTQDIISVAISPDGKYVASGAEDATIRIWNLLENTSSPNLPKSGFLQHYSPQPYLDYDGWCTYRAFTDLFLWISPANMAFVYTPQTHCIIGKRRIQIDLSDYAHGTEWAKCGSQL